MDARNKRVNSFLQHLYPKSSLYELSQRFSFRRLGPHEWFTNKFPERLQREITVEQRCRPECPQSPVPKYISLLGSGSSGDDVVFSNGSAAATIDGDVAVSSLSLTGTYSSSLHSFPCRNIAFPVVGWVDGDRISYTMRTKSGSVDCQSITSWTGYLPDGRLYAEWSLAYFDTGTNRPTLNRGTDVYRPK